MQIDSQLNAVTYTLATVALNQTPLQFDKNCQRIMDALQELARSLHAQPDLVLFPELCISGYGCEDAFFQPTLWQAALTGAHAIAQQAACILPQTICVCGLPFALSPQRLYNCAAILANGQIQALIPKSVLANDGVHYEARWFQAWNLLKQKQRNVPIVSVADTSTKMKTKDFKTVPFGQMLIEHRFTSKRNVTDAANAENSVAASVYWGVEICRDAWLPITSAKSERPALFLASGARQPNLLLNPSASHFALSTKYRRRQKIACETSQHLDNVFVLSNALGCEAGRLIYDGHLLIASQGKLLLEERNFSYRDFVTLTQVLPINAKRDAPNRSHIREPVTFMIDTTSGATSKFKNVLHTTQQYILKDNVRLSAVAMDISTEGYQQFVRALGLGLFDHLRKSGSRTFVLSLSGGADSSACALLIQRMLAYALHELGLENILQRLGRMDLYNSVRRECEWQHEHDTQTVLPKLVGALMPHFLYTIYQSTVNSSITSRDAANKIAKAVNSTHTEVDIQAHVDAYVQQAAKILKRKLNITDDDISLQNIQARSRAPLIWLIANAVQGLLLTTVNRSEAAVGYSTMDGDTAGSLAPLAGVSKTFIREWLRYMEKHGDELLGPLPELHYVNQQKPSAELRPGQSDEDDLMPYAMLDRITELLLREKQTLHSILATLQKEFGAAHTAAELQTYLTRFETLFKRSQWKRSRIAPGFYIDDLSLDASSNYRFPILS